MTGKSPPSGFPFEEPPQRKWYAELPSYLGFLVLYSISPPIGGIYDMDRMYRINVERGAHKSNTMLRFLISTIGFSVGGLFVNGSNFLLTSDQDKTVYRNDETVRVQHIIDPTTKYLPSVVNEFVGTMTTFHIIKRELKYTPHTNVTTQPSLEEKCEYSIAGHVPLDDLMLKELPQPSVFIKGERVKSQELSEYVQQRCLQTWNVEKPYISHSLL